MIFLRNIRGLVRVQSPSNFVKNPLLASLISSHSSEFSFRSSDSCRPFSLWAQYGKRVAESLSGFLKGSVRRADNSEGNEKLRNAEGEVTSLNSESSEELKSLKSENELYRKADNSGRDEKLRSLEGEVASLNNECSEEEKSLKLKRDLFERTRTKRSLWVLFADAEAKANERELLLEKADFGCEDPMLRKELSYDMQIFVHLLHKEGYLKEASFLARRKFDLSYFEMGYAREFLKYAAGKYGKDHQDIAKWLSASDLKTVALFGCPSLARRSVKSAKQMRKFFGIQEYTVCQNCALKELCKFADKAFPKRKDCTRINFAGVIMLLTMYSLESVHQQLLVPDVVKDSVSRLLKEIIHLHRNLYEASQ